MNKPKFKIGDVILRKWDIDGARPWYTQGTKMQIVKITERLYFYLYIDYKHKNGMIVTDNDDIEEVDYNCMLMSELGLILYA